MLFFVNLFTKQRREAENNLENRKKCVTFAPNKTKEYEKSNHLGHSHHNGNVIPGTADTADLIHQPNG